MVNFFNPTVQFTDANGKVLAGGRVTYLDPLTLDLKPIWNDYGRTSPADNPLILGADGRANIYANGLYKVTVEHLVTPGVPGIWAPEYTVELYKADDEAAVGSAYGWQVNTMADLRATDYVTHPIVNVLGYNTPGDGGGGLFIYRASSGYTVNDFTVFASSSGSGQWVRCWVPQVTPMMAGAFPSSTPVESQLTTIALWSQISPIWSNLYIPNGTWNIAGVANFTSMYLNVRCAPQCKFESVGGNGRIVVVCASFDCDGDQQLIHGNPLGVGLTWTPVGNTVIPNFCWFGAGQDESTYSQDVLSHAVDPTYNNSGALRITRPSALAGNVLDCSSAKLIFSGQGKFDCDGATLQVHDYTNDTNAPIFLTTTDSLGSVEFHAKQPNISDFTTGNLTGTLLEQIESAISIIGTRQGELSIDIDVTLALPVNTGDYRRRCTIIPAGGVIDGSAGYFSYGKIEAGTETQVFTQTTTTGFIDNSVAYPLWWAASSPYWGYGLQCAINQAPMVDLAGHSMTIGVTLEQPASGYIGIRNGKLFMANPGMDLFNNLAIQESVTLEDIVVEGHGNSTHASTFNMTSKRWAISNLTLNNLYANFFGMQIPSATDSFAGGCVGGFINNLNLWSTDLQLCQLDQVRVIGGSVGILDWTLDWTTVFQSLIKPQIRLTTYVAGQALTSFVMENIDVQGLPGGLPDGIFKYPWAGKIVSVGCICGDGTAVRNNTFANVSMMSTELEYTIQVYDHDLPGKIVVPVKDGLLLAGTHPRRIDVIGYNRDNIYALSESLKSVNAWVDVQSPSEYASLYAAIVWSAPGAPVDGSTNITLKVYA